MSFHLIPKTPFRRMNPKVIGSYTFNNLFSGVVFWYTLYINDACVCVSIYMESCCKWWIIRRINCIKRINYSWKWYGEWKWMDCLMLLKSLYGKEYIQPKRICWLFVLYCNVLRSTKVKSQKSKACLQALNTFCVLMYAITTQIIAIISR